MEKSAPTWIMMRPLYHGRSHGDNVPNDTC